MKTRPVSHEKCPAAANGAPPARRASARRHAAHLASIALLLTAFAFIPVAVAADLSAAAHNWALKIFTNEGYYSMVARGAKARPSGERQFDVTDLNLTFFTGNADNQVDAVILSPAATFVPDEKLARGEKQVRFIRDDLEASGVRWVYRHDDKKISLDGNVRVVFRAEVKDLLR